MRIRPFNLPREFESNWFAWVLYLWLAMITLLSLWIITNQATHTPEPMQPIPTFVREQRELHYPKETMDLLQKGYFSTGRLVIVSDSARTEVWIWIEKNGEWELWHYSPSLSLMSSSYCSSLAFKSDMRLR